MGSVDRGIHRDHPVHLALGIGLGGQFGKDPVPGAVIGELLVPLPHRLPRPEHLPGKIPPRDPGAVAVGDRLHHGAVITVGTPHLALVARQQRLDSLPLLISENPVTTHPATLPRPSAHGWETRPSSRGRRTRARAMARRWRCPPDRVVPRSPTTVSSPCGRARTNSSARAVRSAAHTSSSVTSVVSSRTMLPRTVSSKTKVDWLTSATWRVRSAWLRSRTSTPSYRTVPRVPPAGCPGAPGTRRAGTRRVTCSTSRVRPPLPRRVASPSGMVPSASTT